jgi:hypothetical protein
VPVRPGDGRLYDDVVTAFVLTTPVRPDRPVAEGSPTSMACTSLLDSGEVDIMAVMQVRDHDLLADVVTKHMAQLDGIMHTRTLLAFAPTANVTPTPCSRSATGAQTEQGRSVCLTNR